MTDCSSLSGITTTAYVNQYVELVNIVGQYEWLTNDNLQGLKTKVLIDVSLIDSDLTSSWY